MSKLILYHYTSCNNLEGIMKNGLKGGHNENGTIFDAAILNYNEPVLCLTAVYRADNENYGGYPLQVYVNSEDVEKLSDDLQIMRGEGVLIPPEDIEDLHQNYLDGICDPSIYCIECQMRSECELIKDTEFEETD